MSDLTQLIENLYRGEISQNDREIAKINLMEFFRILQQIDQRKCEYKSNITQNVSNEVIKDYGNNRNTN